MKMEADKHFFPDANSTLRFTYGKVEGFEPKDGVVYSYYTTIDGIMEKSTQADVPDYRPPQKLIDLYNKKDFGRYGVNGTVPVAFIATNHTTGGNSGSPVLDANGYLIGINFDRCWESTMSDVMFDPNFCRNIALDVRYALFVIDKYAGAEI
jgi:V8-like Glu-specific endopeptidase